MPHATAAPYGRMVVRRGSRDDHAPRVVHSGPQPRDGTVCLGCEAVFLRKTWRRRALPLRQWFYAPRALCPACRQVRDGQSFGEIALRGRFVGDHRDAILRRIRHVAARAAYTQPERRVVSIEDRDDGLHVYTTSQKLAHRLTTELAKAFGGHTRFVWSDRRGRLFAVWEADERGGPPAPLQ